MFLSCGNDKKHYTRLLACLEKSFLKIDFFLYKTIFSDKDGQTGAGGQRSDKDGQGGGGHRPTLCPRTKFGHGPLQAS